jgi:hypothetical protein
LLVWAVVPHALLWAAAPTIEALRPQTVTTGFPAFTGTEMRLPLPPDPPLLSLVCPTGAHPFVWLLCPSAFAFRPHAASPPFPALTGAEISPDSPPEPLDVLSLV